MYWYCKEATITISGGVPWRRRKLRFVSVDKHHPRGENLKPITKCWYKISARNTVTHKTELASWLRTLERKNVERFSGNQLTSSGLSNKMKTWKYNKNLSLSEFGCCVSNTCSQWLQCVRPKVERSQLWQIFWTNQVEAWQQSTTHPKKKKDNKTF